MKHGTWKQLKELYPGEEILESFFAALLFATILFIPAFIISIEVITVFMYRLTAGIMLIILVLLGYVATLFAFWRKSLVLKNQASTPWIKPLMTKLTLIVGAIILVLGILFIVIMVPILWV